MIEHHAASINRRKSLIKKEKYNSVYPWEFPGMPAALVAKVRVDGSNPFARSKFSNTISGLRVLSGAPAVRRARGRPGPVTWRALARERPRYTSLPPP